MACFGGQWHPYQESMRAPLTIGSRSNSVIGNVEESVEVKLSGRPESPRSRANGMNLSATFEGFVPAANPNDWRDLD